MHDRTAGLAPEAFRRSHALREFFGVISTSRDRQGHVFISTMEAKKVPHYFVSARIPGRAVSFVAVRSVQRSSRRALFWGRTVRLRPPAQTASLESAMLTHQPIRRLPLLLLAVSDHSDAVAPREECV